MDMEQGTALFVRRANPNGGMFSDLPKAPMSSLTHIIRVIWAKALSTPVMRNEDFASLWHQILQITSTHSDFSSILGELAASLGEAFQVDGCIIALPDAQVACWHSGKLQFIPRLQAAEMVFKDLPAQSSVNLSDVATPSKCTADELTWKLPELWKAILQSAETSFPIQALLGTTTQFQEQANGLISLMKSLPHPWTEAEIETLHLVSQPIAIALFQLQFQQQLNKRVDYQAVVNRLTLAIRNSSNLPEILQLATESTAKTLQVKRGMLLQLKYSDPLFKSRFQEHLPKIRATVVCESFSESAPNHRDHPPISALHQSFWISECTLCQYVLNHSNGPISATDPQHLPQLDNSSGISPIFNLDQLPALLLSPLESQGAILGFLVFQHNQSRVWQPEEIELVELVSAQVSTAIIQTETLRQVQALVEKRTAELQQSLSVQAKLYERTRQQLEQLRRLNQLKDEFLSTVSHELRTPLTSMTMAIRMLRQVGLSSDRSAHYLDILEQQCAQETNLINDLLALQELESKQVSIQLEEIDLKELIRDLEKSFNQQWAEKGLSLVLDLPQKKLKLNSDRDSLNRILLELLTNAGKYSNPNNPVHLKVTHQLDQPVSKVILTLTNIGPGISPSEIPFIFDKFRRCQGATQNAIQGTGLGLALVKSLVQLLNGSITVSSCPIADPQSWETSFSLCLPQSLDISGSLPG